MARDFRYEIREEVSARETGVGQSLELNLISYNGSKPKWDLRRWQRVEGEEPKMLKGLTFTQEEMGWLVETLQGLQDAHVA